MLYASFQIPGNKKSPLAVAKTGLIRLALAVFLTRPQAEI
jgi:hypothetical protein